MKEIKRDIYLNRLIRRRENGLIIKSMLSQIS